MGLHVIGYDPVMTSEQLREVGAPLARLELRLVGGGALTSRHTNPSRQVGIERGDLDDIWAKCDFITLHTPLTPETANLISDATIDKCKVCPLSSPYQALIQPISSPLSSPYQSPIHPISSPYLAPCL